MTNFLWAQTGENASPINKWAALEKGPRIKAVIDATDAGLDLGWQVYFEPHTGENLPRDLPDFKDTKSIAEANEKLGLERNRDRVEDLDKLHGARGREQRWVTALLKKRRELLNRENTDRDKLQALFDNLKWLGPKGRVHDYRDDILLALVTGPKSGVLVLRVPAYIYFSEVLMQFALAHDKSPLMPTSYSGIASDYDGYFNFFFKCPAGKTFPKNIKIKYLQDREIEILGDGDMLLLPPTTGHWCDKPILPLTIGHWSGDIWIEGTNAAGNETSVIPEIPEMEPWVQALFGIKDQDDEKDMVPEICEMPTSWVQEALEIKDWEENHKQFDEKNRRPKKGIRLEDFIAYLPQHLYIFIATREPWPASSVNAKIGAFVLRNRDGTPKLNEKGAPIKMAASLWLDKNHAAAQMTWAPGEPLEVKDRLVADGGWFEKKGVTTFNLYRPPNIVHGDAANVGPWLNHINKIYPKDAEHILNWMAHRVQHPEIKINHALLLGGGQGIGKDTMLEPVKRAVGAWNFKEVSPSAMMERFNGFLKSVVLRINEVRDLGEISRYNFYEHMKPYITSPPDVLRVDEKNLKAHDIFNCCGIVMTTNHKLDGIYLPADDRRTYVAWSDFKKEDFTEAYWNEIWSFYDNGGDRNIAAWLAQRDISSFNPKAPPFKTDAWHAIVGSNIAPEESELSDALELLGNPNALILAWIETVAMLVGGNLFAWLDDPKNNRAIPHKLASLGYTAVVNPDSAKRSTRWRINKVQQVVYAKDSLSERDRIEAVRGMPKKAPEPPPDPKDENSEQNQEVPF
jgi:hypothetical protein